MRLLDIPLRSLGVTVLVIPTESQSTPESERIPLHFDVKPGQRRTLSVTFRCSNCGRLWVGYSAAFV